MEVPLLTKKGDPAVPVADVGEGITPVFAAGSKFNRRTSLGGRTGKPV